MPVKTTISEEDFKQILLDYDLGSYIGFRTFANGAGQTTVLLETTKGKTVLRYYENRPEKHVTFEVSLFDYLQERSYPVPKVIGNKEGKLWGIYKNKPYVIIEYIDGNHCEDPNKSFDLEKVEKVTEVIAKLHKLTEDYNPEYFKDRYVYDVDYCLNEYQNKPGNIQSKEKEEWLKKELADLEFPNTLPKGLCHADTNYGNFLFRDNQIVAVLDFDMSFYSYVMYDVASLIYWWAMPFGKDVIVERAAFIAKSYDKYRNMSELEKKHIFDSLKLIVLLGFSWSEEDEFEDTKIIIDKLNSIGRGEFNKILFS